MSTTINILTTNDIHGRFLSGDGSDILDYAKLATYKKSLQNCLLVDAGDATQGTPLAILKRGIYPIKIMNAVGYDVVTIGNHEFDNISNDNEHELDTIIAESRALYICANVLLKKNNANYVQSVYADKGIKDRGNGRYLLKQIEGKKLLFVGVCTPEAYSEIPRMKDFIVDKNDVVKEIKSAISDAKFEYQCNCFDAVILLAHIGENSQSFKTKTDIIDKLSKEENVSLIIDGHSHEKYSYDYKDVKIFQADCYSKCFGIIKLTFDDKNKLTITTAYGTNSDISSCKTDEAVKKELDDIKDKIDEEFGTVYSSGSNTTLWGGAIDEDKPYVHEELEAINTTRFVQTNLGRLAAESLIHMLRTKKPDSIKENNYIIAAVNGGGVRDSIRFGKPISDNELFYSLPSYWGSPKDSGYVVFNISIKQLKAILDISISKLMFKDGQISKGSGAFLNTGGIRYMIQYSNISANNMVLGDKVVLTYGKDSRTELKEISLSYEDNIRILLCVDKFIASGGDGYDIIKSFDRVCSFDTPAISTITGEYIQYLSGSAMGKAKPLFYSAKSNDIQYSGFNFKVPNKLSILIKDEKGNEMKNQYVVYSFCDEKGYKNYNAAITDDFGKIEINPPAGASTLCIGATIGKANKNETYLYGELYLHSYFSLKKTALECRVYPFDTSGYFAFDKNAWSQFEHKATNGGKIHYSNYVKHFDENGEECTLTIVEGKILAWLNKDKNIKQVNTVVYLDSNRNPKQFSAAFPKEGISYVTWDNNAFTSKLILNDMPDVSPLYGDCSGGIYRDGCLFAYNHGMEVIGIRVRCGTILDGLGFIYSDNNEFYIGTSDEKFIEKIINFSKGEYIVKVTGCSGTEHKCITNLKIITNIKEYGPFGSNTSDEKFTFEKAQHKIVGLFGEEAQPIYWPEKVVRKIGVMFMPV